MTTETSKKIKATTATQTFLIDVAMHKKGNMWHAYVPGMEEQGLMANGRTQAIALSHLQDAARIVLDDMVAAGKPLPDSVIPAASPMIAVSI